MARPICFAVAALNYSNGRRDLVFALPISFCSIVPLSGRRLGMTIAATIAFAVFMLSGLALFFIKLREEIKRDMPREEL